MTIKVDGHKGRREDKYDGIFLERVEVKMVEMKMAESDNKSGRTQREKAGSSPVWFQLPAIHASSPTPEENTFISSIYSIY